jgi:predicted phosphodiesterase
MLVQQKENVFCWEIPQGRGQADFVSYGSLHAAQYATLLSHLYINPRSLRSGFYLKIKP